MSRWKGRAIWGCTLSLSVALGVRVSAPAQPAAAPTPFLTERHVYVRGETATLQFKADAAADGVAFELPGLPGDMAKPQDGKAAFQVNTALLHAGDYTVRAQPMQAGKPVGEAATFMLTIAPERNPQRYPVWSWNGGNAKSLKRWVDVGINGSPIVWAVRDPLRPGAGADTAALLDEATRLGHDASLYIYPLISNTRWTNDEAARSLSPNGQRTGKPYPREPQVLDYACQTAQSVIDRFADYPSVRAGFLTSEFQTDLSVSPEAKRLAREEAGLDLDEGLKAGWVTGRDLPPELQPKDGIIADDNLRYRFQKWWWERGHGTNMLNLEMAKILQAKRPDLMTWHDPYRLAAVYHSHEGLDCISTWTYGWPDIKHLCYPAVMQAAAKREKQKVMQTITIYVYAYMAVKQVTSTANPAADKPGRDRSYYNSPDYAREATWLALSYRPDLLNYYHFDTPVEGAIRDVSRSLIQPFGATILESRRTKNSVAVLDSAVASWFGGGGGYNTEAILPFCGLLMMDHVPFDVVLDDDVASGGLAGYETLIIPQGGAFTKTMYDRIVAFTRSGKKVIAGRDLRADIPGIIKTDFDFSFERGMQNGRGLNAEQHRQKMEAYADALKPMLAGIPLVADADNKRALVNTLDSGAVRYAFIINDHRKVGPNPTWGNAGIVFDTSEELKTKVRLAVPAGEPAVYDAIKRKPISAAVQGGWAEFETTLPAAQGKFIAVLPEAIGKVEVTAAAAQRGQPCRLTVRVLGVSGKVIGGATPIQVEIADPAGKASEYNRFASTGADSTYQLAWTPAVNDPAGSWTAKVTDLLSGAQAETKIVVQ